MGKPKCKTCLGCMDYIWVDNNRYLNCWFCKTWYAGQQDNLYEVENPFIIVCPDCADNDTTCVTCNGNKKIDRRILKRSD